MSHRLLLHPTRILARPVAGLVASAVLALAVCTLLPGTAAAARPLVITSPPQGAKVVGKVKFSVRASVPVRRVAFFVDGHLRGVDRSRPFRFRRTGVLSTRRMKRGRHRLTVIARRRRGGRLSASSVIYVRAARGKPRRGTAPGSEPGASPVPPPSASPTWVADFEGPSLADWSSFVRDDGGSFYAIGAATEGISAKGGAAVGHFEVTAAERPLGRLHSKVYKLWAINPPETSWTDDAGRLLERLPNNSPAGVYRAWFYLPLGYQAISEWANIFQFKESYLDATGAWHQDPQWWVNLTRADSWGLGGAEPALVLNRWGGPAMGASARVAPRGRWFQITADLHPGTRIDWYLDDQPWFTTTNATYPVGISKAQPVGWVFGVGHYGGLGKLWVDDASFTAR